MIGNLILQIACWLDPRPRLSRFHVEVSAVGRYVVIGGKVIEAPGRHEDFACIGGEVVEMSGFDDAAVEPVPIAAPLPKAGRRAPHPHVTSVAHAGYCLIVDALATFVRERAYEPSVVYVDKAAELILTQYCVEQTWLEAEEPKPDWDTLPLPSKVREKFPTLLGCRVVWDAKKFQFCGDEDPVPRQRHPIVPEGTKCAFSAPFATMPPKLHIDPDNPSAAQPPKVRPFDSIDDQPVDREKVPEGRSIGPGDAEKVARFHGSACKKPCGTCPGGGGGGGCFSPSPVRRFL